MRQTFSGKFCWDHFSCCCLRTQINIVDKTFTGLGVCEHYSSFSNLTVTSITTADLAGTVLTKCVTPEGNVRSDSFQLQLNFEFVQDMEESRRLSKARSLSAAMKAASSSLLDPKERCVHHQTFMLNKNVQKRTRKVASMWLSGVYTAGFNQI